MKRLGFVLPLLMMTALLIGTVVCFSPYAPAAAPAPEDIEAIWSIEDARQESEEPLVRVLYNHGIPLGYDAESNTFYCPLGLEQGDVWPEIRLTAACNSDVKLIFADDYSYDWCKDAIREGYPYQVLAYTDDKFGYFDIVFTGLPVVSVYCENEIGDADTLAQITFSTYGEEPVSSAAHIHLRGGVTKQEPKRNLHVEFVRDKSGKKNLVELSGFGLRENINLNPMVYDETMLRERISWRLYGDLLGKEYKGAFGARKNAYTEVFLNNEYQGVYLLMEPMDAEEELAKEGSRNLLTDGVYRSRFIRQVNERPVIDNPLSGSSKYELRYKPAQSEPFALLEDYLNLLTEPDDEVFCRNAACMDLESVVRYSLLRQVAGLADNVGNNLYLWARETPEGIRYLMAPWDLDYSWGRSPKELGEEYQNWMSFPLVDRMLTCGVAGFKELMLQRWHEWRQSVFTEEHVMGILEQCSAELTDSGAMVRNAERWNQPVNLGVEDLMNFISTRFEVMDVAMDMLEESDHPAFIPEFRSNKSFLSIL